jgi:small subunit ribosomal protein S6
MVRRSEYELVFIARPGLDAEEELPTLTEQVQGWIEAIGGEVTYSDIWGRRRLAYEIRKQREGFYVLMRAMMPRQELGELERQMKLSEDILRYLLVRAETPLPARRSPAPKPAAPQPAAQPEPEPEPAAEEEPEPRSEAGAGEEPEPGADPGTDTESDPDEEAEVEAKE